MPPALGRLGCIVNLAGNPHLEHGPDVPAEERAALLALYRSTGGAAWHAAHQWGSDAPVARWYKVRVWVCRPLSI